MKQLLFLASIACFLLLFDFLILNHADFLRTAFTFFPSKKMANPAAQYCLKQGGERIIKKDQAGNVFGFCRLREGVICEEWSFYRGGCPFLQTTK